MTLNSLGIVLQVLAAAYIVLQAWRTTRALAGSERITIDSMERVIAQLGREMKGQFVHQLIGFVVLAFGAVLQLFG